MISTFHTIRALLKVAASAFVATSAHARQADPPLQSTPLRFITPLAQRASPARLPRGCGATRCASLDLTALAALEPNMRVELAMTDSMNAIGVVEHVARTDARRFTVRGGIEREVDGCFLLVIEDDALAGFVDLPSRHKRYMLQFAGPGEHNISEVRPADLPPCGGGVPDDGRPGRIALPPPAPEGGIAESFGEVPNCSGTVFDVMIPYTNVARQAAGGTNAIRALCKLGVAQTNTAYELSLVSARLRLVWCDEVSYDENGTYNEHLYRLTNTSDGFIDSVHTIRDAYDADLVNLWVDDGEYGGLAWCWSGNPALGFGVTTWWAGSIMAFAHELGHNQGCNHDRENAGSGCNAYSYSYGYRFTGNDGVQYRTIMAYAPGQSIARFSNPDITYQGVPVGVPIGQPLESHNAQTINNTSPIIESFRTTSFDIWVDFPYGGAEQGTFTNPFNTALEGVNALGVAVNGSETGTLWIKSGSTLQGVTIGKPMVIKPCGGPVTIGGSP